MNQNERGKAVFAELNARRHATRLTEVVGVFKLDGGLGTVHRTSQPAVHAATQAPVGQRSAGRRLGAPGGEQLALAR